ncbi:MAG: hypothetical protein AAF363_01040 [Bacteroidota bacterium]
MLPINYVLFSFGNRTHHNRAVLAIYSVLLNYSFRENECVIVYTDSPEYFQIFFNQSIVVFEHLDQNKVNEMLGPIDLIHRVKIGVIEDALKKFPGNTILYFDSDTFFTKNLNHAKGLITEKDAIMHLVEFNMGSVPEDFPPAPTTYDFAQMIGMDEFELGNEVVRIDAKSFNSWNAGLIGLHPSHLELIPLVYQLTDQWYPKVPSHASEQYAFSYVLQNNLVLHPGESFCYHYWYHAKKKVVDSILENLLGDNFLETELDERSKKMKSLISRLPNLLNTHFYIHHDKAIQDFLKRRYFKGYLNALKTILSHPEKTWTMLKDAGYYTRIRFDNEL